jgi:formamidopyrimidine-DNA glycosylase
MPELPEVETMVRGLRPALTGRRLRRLEVRDPSLVEGCSATELSQRGRGATVAGITRRGKWVVLELAGHRGIIVIQPRMTGGFWLVEPQRPEHIRLAFHVEKPRATVWYCDTRRLGKICWYADAESAAREFAWSHGPDALEIGRDELADRLARTARGIKPTLMDQKVLAGIGNIYADEVLHRARIHPERKAATLSPEQLDRLHRAIGEILSTAIALEGSSFDAGYRTVLGLEGGFLAQNSVYGRENLPCPTCKRPIIKTKIAGLIGRPTYYCPGCQVRE